jgi:hypothetical protein
MSKLVVRANVPCQVSCLEPGCGGPVDLLLSNILNDGVGIQATLLMPRRSARYVIRSVAVDI